MHDAPLHTVLGGSALLSVTDGSHGSAVMGELYYIGLRNPLGASRPARSKEGPQADDT